MDNALDIYTIDAFTSVPFSGNPAAICHIRNRSLSEEMLQKIATEMNLSETAYVKSDKENFQEGSNFSLRWFTPTNEVKLCGHATLAAAASLFYVLRNPNPVITFNTLSGELRARNDNGYITLDLPMNPPVKQDISPEVRAIFDLIFTPTAKDRIQEVWLSPSAQKLVIRMNDDFAQKDIEELNPDISKMTETHDGSKYKGVIVTTKGSGDYDFLSRYFAPWNGIPEDPVTGSAHTVLAPLWGEILGKKEMLARQCSKRGGDLKIALREDGRVDVGGKAIVVLKGNLMLPKEA
ncbi:unnamed protein product [Clavelina lepadiformis]|uniref:Phenazine biosynthesis-like domain-containing protein n=1 Tax=Clavelina lepadiformis TaxID=159417 RepID=A0ABP0G215_CLALP